MLLLRNLLSERVVLHSVSVRRVRWRCRSRSNAFGHNGRISVDEKANRVRRIFSAWGGGDILHMGYFISFIHYAAAQCFYSVAYPEERNLPGKILVQPEDFFQCMHRRDTIPFAQVFFQYIPEGCEVFIFCNCQSVCLCLFSWRRRRVRKGRRSSSGMTDEMLRAVSVAPRRVSMYRSSSAG